MKTKLTLLAGLFVGATIMGNLYAQDEIKAEEKKKTHTIMTEGVAPGKITQDYDAAMAYAKEKKLPVLLIFTGSDWCGWCKIMDANVFTKPEWIESTKDTLVQVWIDFPKDKSLVPEKYHARNKKLSEKYSIEGYPTYCVLGSDGSIIDKLGAGKTKTPESFKAEIDKLLIMTNAGIKRFCTTLKSEDAVKVEKNFKLYKALQKEYAAAKIISDAIETKTNEAKKAFNQSLKDGKLNNMTPEVKAQYDAAIAKLAVAKKNIEDWMKVNAKSKPTPELRKIYSELMGLLQNATQKVDNFL